MRLVLQRVKSGRVSVAGEPIAEIGMGLVILLGIGPDRWGDASSAAFREGGQPAHLRG